MVSCSPGDEGGERSSVEWYIGLVLIAIRSAKFLLPCDGICQNKVWGAEKESHGGYIA